MCLFCLKLAFVNPKYVALKPYNIKKEISCDWRSLYTMNIRSDLWHNWKDIDELYKHINHRRRSQWPRGLRRRSAAARLLRLWVRTPQGHGCQSIVNVVRQKSVRRADHSSRGVLPSVVRRCVWSRNLVNEEALANRVLLRTGLAMLPVLYIHAFLRSNRSLLLTILPIILCKTEDA